MSKSFFQKIFGSPTSSTSPSATSATAPVQNLTPAQKEQLRLQEERQREQQKRQVVNNMIRNTATAVMSANGFKACIVRTTDTTFTMDVQIPGSCSSYGRIEGIRAQVKKTLNVADALTDLTRGARQLATFFADHKDWLDARSARIASIYNRNGTRTMTLPLGDSPYACIPVGNTSYMEMYLPEENALDCMREAFALAEELGGILLSIPKRYRCMINPKIFRY